MRRSIPCFPHASFEAYSNLIPYKQGRRVVRHSVVFVASFLLLTGVAPRLGASSKAQDEQGAVPEPGKAINGEIGGGEAHSYRITLAAGQFFRAVVDQKGINLILTLYNPDGTKICDLDSPVGAQGPEPFSLIAETLGNYRLEVRAWQKNAPKGRYELRVEELRAATSQDKKRVAAERAFAEATLTIQGTAESLRKAIEKYEEVATLWQALGDRQQEAHTLTVIGHYHGNLAEYRKAIDYYNRALTLARSVGDRSGEALLLYNAGLAYDHLGDPRKTLDFYNQALAIYLAVGDRSMEAATLGNMGVVYSGLGEQRKALEIFNRALPLKQAASDPYGEATLLNNIGLVHSYMGERQKALEFFNRALPIYQALNDRSGEGSTLNNIGSLYGDLGDHRKALEFLEQVLQIKRAAGNRVEEAIALNNIGVAYGNLGEHRKALEFYNQSLPLTQAAGARSSEANTLSNIGKAYSELGEQRKALEFYNQSLLLRREVGDRRGEATTLTNLGRAYHRLGEPWKAMDCFNQALLLRQAVSDRGGEAVTRYNIARAQRDLDNLAEARVQIETALAIAESLRSNVASQGLRTSYLASVQKYYELGIDLLMRLHKQQPAAGFAAAALHTSERARARSMLELLAEARADIRQGVSPALIERERSLQQLLDAKAVAQTRLLGGKHSAEQAAAAAKEIAALMTEYDEVQTQIRQTSPRYAALTQPTPLQLAEIQTEVLDPDTLLLEYSLGEERSYLWAVTPVSIESFELPKRAEIERVARQAHRTLIARNQLVPNETPAQRRRRLDQADAEYPKASATLSQMLLGPVASVLGNKRLLIVSDGVLQYLPFSSLPEPVSATGQRGDRATGQEGERESRRVGEQEALNNDHRPVAQSPSRSVPLIVNHEIISLPSASVAQALRRETAGRKPASKTLAVLADPVFSQNDPRVAVSGRSRAAIEATPIMTGAARSAEESGPADLVRLRFSRLEADEIARLADDKMKLEALDFAASRALVTSDEIGQYRLIHFATHGLIDSLHPELSGIVLSLVDDQGHPQNGFLRLYDIYNLKLGADLVTLSACQTALGKEVKGEGLIGLTRGFMYAGTPRVVASLWRVDDRASAELMKRFYQGVLGEGLRPAAALRAAQVSMWKDKRWQAPHYWAAYTFQGEWKESGGREKP